MLTIQKPILYATLALTLFSALPVDADTFADRRGRRPAPGERRRRPGRRPVPQELRQFVRALEFTDAQKAQFRAAAQSVAPRVREAREEAFFRVQAERARRNPDFEALREELRELRARTLDETAPHARRLVASLTPEQRARIEEAARARGREFDIERLEDRVARLLAHPRLLRRLSEARERVPATR